MTEEEIPDIHLKVLYDFEYTDRGGRRISIKEGEKLLLIKKTNSDWWQVISSSSERPFYVPATYVKEIRRSSSGQKGSTRTPYQKEESRKGLHDVSRRNYSRESSSSDSIPPHGRSDEDTDCSSPIQDRPPSRPSDEMMMMMANEATILDEKAIGSSAEKNNMLLDKRKSWALEELLNELTQMRSERIKAEYEEPDYVNLQENRQLALEKATTNASAPALKQPELNLAKANGDPLIDESKELDIPLSQQPSARQSVMQRTDNYEKKIDTIHREEEVRKSRLKPSRNNAEGYAASSTAKVSPEFKQLSKSLEKLAQQIKFDPAVSSRSRNSVHENILESNLEDAAESSPSNSEATKGEELVTPASGSLMHSSSFRTKKEVRKVPKVAPVKPIRKCSVSKFNDVEHEATILETVTVEDTHSENRDNLETVVQKVPSVSSCTKGSTSEERKLINKMKRRISKSLKETDAKESVVEISEESGQNSFEYRTPTPGAMSHESDDQEGSMSGLSDFERSAHCDTSLSRSMISWRNVSGVLTDDTMSDSSMSMISGDLTLDHVAMESGSSGAGDNHLMRRSTTKLMQGTEVVHSRPVEEDATGYLVVPKGWRESFDEETGQPCYINIVTGAKWYSSNDSEGRVYFFQENSHESSWVLPEISITPSEIKPCPEVPAPSPPVSTKVPPSEGKKKSIKKKQEDDVMLRSSGHLELDGDNQYRMAKAHSMVLVDPRGEKQTSGKSSSFPRNWPELWDGNMCVLKEGTLNRTKITENGKKLRKNWAPAHVVLTELFLLFFKDAKAFVAMKNAHGDHSSEAVRPELSVDLNGALLERGNKVSSRRNVFLVSTVLGLQVLVQCDNAVLAEEWYQAIQKAIKDLPSGYNMRPISKFPQLSPQHLGSTSPDETKKSLQIGRSRSLKVKSSAKDESQEDLATTGENPTKIKARLKKFFHRRPTKESLVKKGIYRDEPVFGCHLPDICGNEPPRIPLFVQRCIAAIESKEENMKTDGLYRASGNLSQVQKIRLQIDQNNLSILEQEEDVHVLTGALKLFFRELRKPLIPFEYFNKALQASTNPNKKEKIQQFREIVKALPGCNRETLDFLLKHLLRVTQYQEFNRMHIPNLAIVFGPTLMWPEAESLNMALDLMQQNLVIECFLQEYDSIFR